jgi:hypothetical protein
MNFDLGVNLDVAPPNDDTTPWTTYPLSGPMTRARLKAIHDKVNSLLSTLDLGTLLDEMLPHVGVLCVIRYEGRQGRVEEPLTLHKEDEEGRRREEK